MRWLGVLFHLSTLPGFVVIVLAGSQLPLLLGDELFPDPGSIARGMAWAHAFIPLLLWTMLGVFYLLVLHAARRLVRWSGRRRVAIASLTASRSVSRAADGGPERSNPLRGGRGIVLSGSRPWQPGASRRAPG